MNIVNLILLLITIFSYGCSKNLGTNEKDQFRRIESFSGDEKVTFDLLKQQVMEPHCLRCHSWVTNEEKVKRYIEAGEPENSELYQLINSGEMPKDSAELPKKLKMLVFDYINSLAAPLPRPSQPEPKPEVPSGNIPGLSYNVELLEDIKEKIFVPNCIDCHSWVTKDERIFKYIEPGDPENSELYEYLRTGDMPLGGDPLSDEDLAKVYQFIKEIQRTR